MRNETNQRVLVLCTFMRQDKTGSWDDVSMHQRLFSVVPPVKISDFQNPDFIYKHCGWKYKSYYVGLAAIFKLDQDVFQHDMEVINL
jgi:hypothetical protein